MTARMTTMERIAADYAPDLAKRGEEPVPEWTREGEEPFKVYWVKAWTLGERTRLFEKFGKELAAGTLSPAMFVETLMIKAIDDAGKRMFPAESMRLTLMNEARPATIQRIALAMVGDLNEASNPTAAEGNSEASPTSS